VRLAYKARGAGLQNQNQAFLRNHERPKFCCQLGPTSVVCQNAALLHADYGVAMLQPLRFARGQDILLFGTGYESLDVPKCKNICRQRLSIHLSSFAMSSSIFREASEEAMIVRIR
jgi:hypothetical protein